MDELIQKYLDGDLNEEEAAAFTEALSRQPELETELQAFERILAMASAADAREPSEGFSDAVMNRIVDSTAPSGTRRRARPAFLRGLLDGARPWGLRVAWAAGLALVFTLGFLTARQGGQDIPTAVGPIGDPTTQMAASGSSAAGSIRLVRLVYIPSDTGIDRVTVAGTFNGWDPDALEMRRHGGAWIAELVLPPESYEYMFVEDGESWVTDPLALHTRDDGFGRKNAVLDLSL